MNNKNIFFAYFIFIITMSPSCKKEDEDICVEAIVYETTHIFNVNTIDTVILPESNDEIVYSFMVFYESRCDQWILDNSMNCGSYCGEVKIGGNIMINNSYTFKYEPSMAGCTLEQSSYVYESNYNNIEIILLSVTPYPVDYLNLNPSAYQAQLLFRQLIE